MKTEWFRASQKTMERLLNLGLGAIALGYNHDDALTIKWAADTLIAIAEAVKTFRGTTNYSSSGKKVCAGVEAFRCLIESIPAVLIENISQRLQAAMAGFCYTLNIAAGRQGLNAPITYGRQRPRRDSLTPMRTRWRRKHRSTKFLVSWKNVSFGDKDVSIGFSMSRSKYSPVAIDKILTGASGCRAASTPWPWGWRRRPAVPWFPMETWKLRPFLIRPGLEFEPNGTRERCQPRSPTLTRPR